MPGLDEHTGLSHDAPCTYCGHGPHSVFPCSDTCGCTHAERIGIDTALGG